MSAARKNKRSQRLLNRLFRVSRTSSASASSCRLHSNCHDEWAGDNRDVCSELDADVVAVVIVGVVAVVAVVVVVVTVAVAIDADVVVVTFEASSFLTVGVLVDLSRKLNAKRRFSFGLCSSDRLTFDADDVRGPAG